MDGDTNEEGRSVIQEAASARLWEGRILLASHKLDCRLTACKNLACGQPAAKFMGCDRPMGTRIHCIRSGTFALMDRPIFYRFTGLNLATFTTIALSCTHT